MGSRRRANAADIAAVQPFWSAVFSNWNRWVQAIRAAANAGLLDDALSRGVSMRCTTIVPTSCTAISEPWAFGAVPHIKPQAQNDIIDAALGPVEAACFFASVATLFP